VSTRVAMVLGSSTGGIGRHVSSLVAGLGRRGMTVTVYAPAETLARFDFAASGADTHRLAIAASPDPRDLRSVLRLSRALRVEPVDVIHAHGLRAGLVAALARGGIRGGTRGGPGGGTRRAAVPLVVTWHNAVLGGGVRVRALRTAERMVARAAEITLAASDDLVDRVRELGGPDVRLCAVAAPRLGPPARDPAQVRDELGATGRPLILSVGRLHPQKGYDVLIAAAARWRYLDPVPVVVIAGTGPAYRGLAARISQARAPVWLLGHRHDVGDLLAAADLAVVSSVWEARQLFAQEALAAGVPLVATAVGGLPGLLGDAAALVPVGDVDALDAAVRRLLDHPDARARLATAGRRRAAGWPSEADTIEQVVAVYAELTGATGPTAGGVGLDPAGDDPSGSAEDLAGTP
jgi:glycosyltransferase involved in cell wall biosynthesis